VIFRAVAQDLPDGKDALVYIRLLHDNARPDPREQFIFINQPPPVLNQHHQSVQAFRWYRDGHTITKQNSGFWIQRKRAEGVTRHRS
jgi:hypothetical protein